MSKVHIQQGTEDWKKWRNSIIGASDSPIILGQSPYKTKRQLWEEKVGLSQSVSNDAMRLGHQLEPVIRQMVNDRLGSKFEAICYQSDEFKWMGASLDGESEEVFLEIKVNNEVNHTLAKKKEIPLSHTIQMNHAAIVSNKQGGIYASFNPKSEDLVILDFTRDNNLYNTLIEETRRFWELVRSFEPPELGNDDWEEINDPEVFEMAAELDAMQSQAKQLEKEIKETKDKIVSMTKAERNYLIGKYKLMRQEKKGNIDYSKIESLKTIDLEQYRKTPSQFWVLK